MLVVRYAALSTDVQFYSLTVLNSVSLVGRILSGLAADILGCFNILLLLVVIIPLVMSAVWLPFGFRDEATLYAVVAIFGSGSDGRLYLLRRSVCDSYVGQMSMGGFIERYIVFLCLECCLLCRLEVSWR